ncbi:hypothetical protein AB0M39_13960 [Streptomyces sp. NPDC051907]|uniref:hypothetical protein n=1 Tax=Streptomyces sp. NPDC051907 TaxID=3155284 RepID=UPI00342FBA74
MAYRAGLEAGRSVYDTAGKGAAVRDATWGGCTRRPLDADTPESEVDRGAWVQGCLDGVFDKPAAPPAAAVTRRAENSGLLRSFRAWAEDNGGQESAPHVSKLTTTQLTKNDDDIELTAVC